MSDYKLIKTFIKQTKKCKYLDEVYKISFEQSKEFFKFCSLKQLKYEKRKFDLRINFYINWYNRFEDLFAKIYLILIGILVSVFTTSPLFELDIDKRTTFLFLLRILPLLLIIQAAWFSILNNKVKTKICIVDAIINTLDQLIEEKHQSLNKIGILEYQTINNPKRKRIKAKVKQ